MMLVSGLEQHRCCPTSQSPGEQLTWGGAGRLVPRGSCDDAVALVRREVEWNVQRKANWILHKAADKRVSGG
jgi:hypothetical protein